MESRIWRTLKVLFSFDNLAITIATIGAIAAFYFLPQNFDFLDPVKEALGDLDITDMVFSQFRNDEDIPVDTNVVLVNIGMSDRAGIAQILNNVNWYEPAVVGIDAFFRAPKDSAGDAALQEALAKTPNLVLLSKVAYAEESKEEDVERWEMSHVDPDRLYDTLELSHPMFARQGAHGFANLVLDNEASFMTCREVSFIEPWTGGTEYSFPVEIVRRFDPAAADRALERGVGEQVINFHGNIGTYYNLDEWQASDPELDLSFLKGKIVLLGYMGPDFETKSLEDNFFTPLNHNYVGRSFPDMYGVVIHANTISMILRGNYIETMSTEASIWIGLLVLVINVMIFTYMFEHHENWYDVFAVSLQLLESLGMAILIVYVFDNYDYKLALTPAIVSVFVVGTIHDLYQDSIKKLILTAWERAKRRRKTATSDVPPRTDGGYD